MLWYSVLHVLRHFVHWNWYIKAMCSTVVCCNPIVLCGADRTGMAAPRLLEWYLFFSRVLRFWLCFASRRCKLYCSGCMKVATGALAADFFGANDFPFKTLFWNRRFSAWASSFGFGAAIYIAVVRNSTVYFATQSLEIAVKWLRQGFSLLRVRA